VPTGMVSVMLANNETGVIQPVAEIADRARVEQGLVNMGAAIFGAKSRRVPNTCYFAFKGIDGETLIIELDKLGFGVAAGAACSSANPEPSATLLAMGVAPEIARGAVRFSLGAANTAQQVDDFLVAVKQVVARFRKLTAMAV
jgi:cysteine desulfurase